MFYHFLVAYKAEIPMYSWSNFKATPLIERVLLFLSSGFLILSCITILLHKTIITISGFILGVVFLLLLYIIDSHMRKKYSNVFFKRYTDKKLNPLIELLKRDEFNFYTIAKIEWLIKNCEAEISHNTYTSKWFSSFFERFIFPIITLLIGFVGSKVSLSDTTVIVVAICMFLLLLYLVNSIIAPMVYEIFHPDREVLVFLKSELEYIKITLTE